LFIRSILVHVDTSPACEERVRLAMRIARRFGAYVTGLSVVTPPALLVPPEPGAAVVLTEYIAAWTATAEAAGERFRGMLQAEGLSGEWVKEDGAAIPILTRWARSVDLLVLGQHDPEHLTELRSPEDIILGCGLPVLVVPYVGVYDHVGENSLVAWNGSREAVRAAHDALNLLKTPGPVTILSVNPSSEERQYEFHMHRLFAQHDLEPKIEHIVSKELSPAEAVLSRIADFSNDMLVMGAFSHSRLRQIILGGMTRDILNHMTVPVLMSH
jgi:nucleotide-binding universal stress UspA family protein